jgi:hypothetical protein
LSRLPAVLSAGGFRAFLFLGCLSISAVSNSQVSVVTYHNDVSRSGLNANETILTPANVNKTTFGFRFSNPVDAPIVGQPLYLPNVTIAGLGVHNVIYVGTLNDSVYAYDADSNTGLNASPLWKVNFTNAAAGVTTASGTYLPCQTVTKYTQAGIIGTPVIDPTTLTLYVVAKTNENGTVVHRLHALDATSGTEKFGGPIIISGSFTGTNGVVAKLNSLHAMNRPALLLNNGIVYIAFGSNGCNDTNYGWVFAYNAATLAQTGIFNTSPNTHYSSIWHAGSGLSADESGFVYASTGEGKFTASTGGMDFGSSILKLNPETVSLADYFTPANELYISAHDLDLSSCGTLVLPDQPGTIPHLLVASGKQGIIYLLNRDNMGKFNAAGDTQIVQELPSVTGAIFGAPAYWNNMVYFAGNSHGVVSLGITNAHLTTTPVAESTAVPGDHAPIISANGTTNGVVWTNEGTVMYAFDAVTMKTLYSTNQSGTRDTLPATAHFATPMVANGKVYVGTLTSLAVYGLL